jgi:hypothetical protein
MSTGTWKATDTTSRSTSNESVQVTSQILLVGVLVLMPDKSGRDYISNMAIHNRDHFCQAQVMSQDRYQQSHSLCIMGSV